MFDENQYLNSIKTKVFVELPFTKEELTSDIFDLAVEKALGDLNQFRPKTIKSLTPITNPDYKLIRAYSNQFDTESVIPFIEEYGVDIGMVHIYTKPWTLKEISKERIPDKYFKLLAAAYCGMFMANIRRTADMNSLPFSIKGDQFYNEFLDMANGLKDQLINHTPNTL